jgi:hypothetical protein
MRRAMRDLSISAVRADGLFVSALLRCEQPSAGQVRQAIAAAVRAFGERGYAERVAQEFGEHPRPRSRGCAGPASLPSRHSAIPRRADPVR